MINERKLFFTTTQHKILFHDGKKKTKKKDVSPKIYKFLSLDIKSIVNAEFSIIAPIGNKKKIIYFTFS